jgi:hypothetical protein
MKASILCGFALLAATGSPALAQEELNYVEFNEYSRTQAPKDQLSNCRELTWTKMLGSTRYTRTEIFCDDPSGRLIKMGDRKLLPQNYLRPDQFSARYINPDSLSPSQWVGRSPVDKIGASDLFTLNELYVAQALDWANAFDGGKRHLRPVRWGKVVEVGRGSVANTTVFAFPFCLDGQCDDPDSEAPNFGVIVQDSSGGRPFASLVLAAQAPFGTRNCRIYSGKYATPVCYNEKAAWTATRATLAAQARALLPRYDRIAAAYEASHPPEPGSLRDLADNSECGFIAVETVFGDGRKEYSTKLMCEYRPHR